MGGSIPWTAINAYAMRHGIDGDQFYRLVRHVRAMDQAVQEYHEKQRAKG